MNVSSVMDTMLPGNTADEADVPETKLKSSLRGADIISDGAYHEHAEQFRYEDNMRRKNILALVAGTAALVTMMFRLPELWKLWITIGLLSILICDRLENARCKNMVKHANIGQSIEAKAPNALGTFFNHLDMSFNRFKLTKGEWFTSLALLVYVGLWANFAS